MIVIVEKDPVGKATVALEDSHTRANMGGKNQTDLARNTVGVTVLGGLLV